MTVSQLEGLFSKCEPAAGKLYTHQEELLVKTLTNGNIDSGREVTHPLLQGENVLLQLAAKENMTDGVLYCLPLIYANVMIVRSVHIFPRSFKLI